MVLKFHERSFCMIDVPLVEHVTLLEAWDPSAAAAAKAAPPVEPTAEPAPEQQVSLPDAFQMLAAAILDDDSVDVAECRRRMRAFVAFRAGILGGAADVAAQTDAAVEEDEDEGGADDAGSGMTESLRRPARGRPLVESRTFSERVSDGYFGRSKPRQRPTY
jgi:hypothetical protein